MEEDYSRKEDERELRLLGITYNQIESGVYALILEEVDGRRRIPIVIGYPEAQSIECRLQNVRTPRPLTHDLMSSMIDALGARLEKATIRRLENGVFAAYLHLVDHNGNKLFLDARSSDAVALCIRVGAPIYTSASVLDEVGFIPDDRKKNQRAAGSASVKDSKDSDDHARLEAMPTARLRDLLDECVSNEDYEKASEIKRILDSRT